MTTRYIQVNMCNYRYIYIYIYIYIVGLSNNMLESLQFSITNIMKFS